MTGLWRQRSRDMHISTRILHVSLETQSTWDSERSPLTLSGLAGFWPSSTLAEVRLWISRGPAHWGSPVGTHRRGTPGTGAAHRSARTRLVRPVRHPSSQCQGLLRSHLRWPRVRRNGREQEAAAWLSLGPCGHRYSLSPSCPQSQVPLPGVEGSQ